MSKQGYLYILVNKNNTVMYIGSTSDLIGRIYQHKNDFVDGFSKKYKTHKLIYFEVYNEIYDAINREYQLKKWSRKKKNNLVQSLNPYLKDLYNEIS